MPASDVVSFDPYDPGLTEPAVWRAYEHLQAGCPVARSEERGGFWVMSRFDDVRTALLDPQTFSSASGHRIPTDGTQTAIPIDVDPPLHTGYRRVLRDVMSPARVRALRPFLHGIVDDLVGTFRERGGGDVVGEIALPLPLLVLTELVGFSSDTVARFRTVTEEMWGRIATAGGADADRQISDLMRDELADHRRRRPDDFVTRLLDARVDDRPLGEDEQVALLATLAVAGHETTMNAAATLVHLLVTEPGAQERLRTDPSAAPRYVEEMLRLRTPAQNFARRTTCPVEVAGTAIPEGDGVLLSYAAANRDPARFPDPDRFDPGRDTRGQLAFGWGVHLCLGATLARTELTVLLETLVRHPPLRLDGEVAWSSLRGGNHFGPTRLPVVFAR